MACILTLATANLSRTLPRLVRGIQGFFGSSLDPADEPRGDEPGQSGMLTKLTVTRGLQIQEYIKR